MPLFSIAIVFLVLRVSEQSAGGERSANETSSGELRQL
jgi:hypothetical protein